MFLTAGNERDFFFALGAMCVSTHSFLLLEDSFSMLIMLFFHIEFILSTSARHLLLSLHSHSKNRLEG